MKVTLSSTLSINTKNTFHGLPYVTKYVWFKPNIGTLFNFCQLLCTFLRYLYSRIPSVVMLAHVYQGAGVRISFWLQLPITEIMTWNQIWGRKFVGTYAKKVGSCFKARGYYHAHKFLAANVVSSHYLSYWKMVSKWDLYTGSLSYMCKHHYRR